MSSDNFILFSEQIREQFHAMGNAEIYVTAIDPDALWDAYLDSFPAGTNEIFRKRRKYDGSYDRSFVRQIGILVALDRESGELTSIWDAPNVAEPYATVCRAIRKKFFTDPDILGVFRTDRRNYGNEPNIEKVETPEGVREIRWTHFTGSVSDKHYSKTPAADAGELNTTISMYANSLQKLRQDVVLEIVKMLDDNELYRGAEYADRTKIFQARLNEYHALPTEAERRIFTLVQPMRFTGPVADLIKNLSEDMGIGEAMGRYKAKVDPTNMHRSKSAVTQGMVDRARATISELGLESALHRRFARIDDISVGDVLWVNVDTATKMRPSNKVDAAFATLAKPKVYNPDESGVVFITPRVFVNNVLPIAQDLALYYDKTKLQHRVSLTAPVYPEADTLFKWDNPFAWSYAGNLTDASIRERVEKAGGKINCAVRVSLSWHSHDDLDLHCHFKRTGGERFFHIFYNNPHDVLDVDMNRSTSNLSDHPVENMAFDKPGMLGDGTYIFSVHQYSKRDERTSAFEIEFAQEGHPVRTISFGHDLPHNGEVGCLRIEVVDGKIVSAKVVDTRILESSAPEEVWGVRTNTFVPVSAVMKSPNFWDGKAIGNEHLIFALEHCAATEPTIGIYNEYLRPDLREHRRVFEILAERTQCESIPDPLCGMGFSITQKDGVVIRVKSKSGEQTDYRIAFGVKEMV